MWRSRSSSLITLDLHRPRRPAPRRLVRPVPVTIPTDLLFTAFRQLFPAERMVLLGGRRTSRGIRLTSAADVTEARPSRVHVNACPERLAVALIDLERTGAHFAMWLHSHPGGGLGSTWPSAIDRTQEQTLRQHYSGELVSAIAVADGTLRFWGPPLEDGLITIRWRGDGVRATEVPDAWQLVLS